MAPVCQRKDVLIMKKNCKNVKKRRKEKGKEGSS